MSVGDIRIRAKRKPSPPTHPGYPAINYTTDWSDIEVYLVGERGEIPLSGIKSIEFKAHEGDREPLTATLVCYVDEIDIEVEAK